MVRFLLLSSLLLFHDVASLCPDLKIIFYKDNYVNASGFTNLFLYKYKSVDLRIQSPFFVDEGQNKYLLLEFLETKKYISSLCTHRKQNVTLNSFEQINYKKVNLYQTNKSNILQVDYEQDTFASGSKYKMEEIYVIDYLSGRNANNFISLYGCKMVEIYGKMTMFEGTIIFSDFFFDQQDVNEFEPFLNKTYSFLQGTANISKESLKTHTSVYNENETDSCDDIIKRQGANHVAAKKISIDNRFVLSFIVCAVILIILVLYIFINVCEY